jgi:queuine/archaeosine tRNA-ribosyltransferase
MKHGKYSTYTNHRCRCEACRRANREHSAHLRKGDGTRHLHTEFAHLLHELFPLGLTDDCPARKANAA